MITGLLRHTAHGDFCLWHVNQANADCSCGAVVPPLAAGRDSLAGAGDGEYIFIPSTGERLAVVYPERPVKQSKADSFMESVTNIAIGLAISMVAYPIVMGAVLGHQISIVQNVALSVIFTAISLARSYALRRAFNGRSVWAAIRGRS